MDKMRIVATADLHGSLPDIPECDLLLIAGDICPMDNHEKSYQALWLVAEFRPWLLRQPARHIVFIGGNHDFVCQMEGFEVEAAKFGATYLQDSLLEIEGLRIWGTPWVRTHPRWAFHLSDAEGRERFRQIPESADIILSHGPVAGILDDVRGESTGSSSLASQLQRVSPLLFISGHIHECGGRAEQIGETTFVNASRMDKDYNPAHPLIEIELLGEEGGWRVQSLEGEVEVGVS